jgi:hypothetical protein
MLKSFTVLFVFVFTTASIAQNKEVKYDDRSAEIQKEIWDNPSQPFTVTQVPSAMDSESAVIIARSFEVINSAKSKLKFGLGFTQRITYQTTIHERVKINDKAALDDYSTLEYTKKLDLTYSRGFLKLYNKTDSYIGAKIIKPDGTESIVNTNEEVFTKNESRDKEGKLAISNLQVGDILDYYIRVEKMQEADNEVQGPYTFLMGGDYPMLYYNARLQLDEHVGVEYISANGAPPFKESKNDDGDIVLELIQQNLPKYQSTLWTSPLRQYPYISLQYKFVTKAEDNHTHFNRGEVKHGYLSDDLVDQFNKAIESQSSSLFNFYPLTLTENYFGGAKKMKDIPQDSIVKVLYNAWRYSTFCSFATDDINMSNDINYNYANSLIGAINLSRMLTSLDIDNTIYLVCSRNSTSLKNVMTMGDFDALVKVTAGKQYWLAFDDIVTQFNEIPSRFQGEDAITMQAEKQKKSVRYSVGRGKVPVTAAGENTITENINVSLDPSNMQLLKIDRTCQQTGALRHNDQKQLLLMEDIEGDLATTITQKKLLERLSADKKSQKLVDEFSAAFAKERSNQKSYFIDEIDQQYNNKPKDISGFAIQQAALFNSKAPFEYSTSFSMENFVKKAGNNYIIEAGKLVGDYQKVDDKERIRNIDVYMPCARTLNWEITINIPKGYNVKGVNEMNRSISNEAGSFNCTATTDGSAVKIKVSRTYINNFEKAEAWSKLLEMMDMFYNFTTQKILLEKTKS